MPDSEVFLRLLHYIIMRLYWIFHFMEEKMEGTLNACELVDSLFSFSFFQDLFIYF